MYRNNPFKSRMHNAIDRIKTAIGNMLVAFMAAVCVLTAVVYTAACVLLPVIVVVALLRFIFG